MKNTKKPDTKKQPDKRQAAKKGKNKRPVMPVPKDKVD